MRRTATAAGLLLLAAVVLLSGCGDSTPRGTPTVDRVALSSNERAFFAKFHTTAKDASVARSVAAVRLERRLRVIASARRAHVVTLSVYDLAADARLTPVETIAVSEPARFLSRSAAEIVRSLNPGPYFLRIVDADGRDVLELWTPRPGQGGYTVDPAYAGCSTITQNGLGMPPPCPRR